MTCGALGYWCMRSGPWEESHFPIWRIWMWVIIPNYVSWLYSSSSVSTHVCVCVCVCVCVHVCAYIHPYDTSNIVVLSTVLCHSQRHIYLVIFAFWLLEFEFHMGLCKASDLLCSDGSALPVPSFLAATAIEWGTTSSRSDTLPCLRAKTEQICMLPDQHIQSAR